MAAMRKFCEILSVGDVVAVITQRAKESGLKLETIVDKAAVTMPEWDAIVALADDRRIKQLRDVARAAGVELAAIESPGHAPWRDPHSPTSHPKREPGLHDHHLS
ncbi:MAG: hypothetical protein WA733_10575 [Methylocystis sp.]